MKKATAGHGKSPSPPSIIQTLEEIAMDLSEARKRYHQVLESLGYPPLWKEDFDSDYVELFRDVMDGGPKTDRSISLRTRFRNSVRLLEDLMSRTKGALIRMGAEDSSADRWFRLVQALPFAQETGRLIRSDPTGTLRGLEEASEIVRFAIQSITKPKKANSVSRQTGKDPLGPFRKRAKWLEDRRKERAWSKNYLGSHPGGPDVKTVNKILKGLEVREDVFERLAKALSAHHGFPPVEPRDIPRN